MASAGNDCTDRPCFPAAFSVGTAAPTCRSSRWVPSTRTATTDALFSNVGDWVTDYARGAAVFSTMPTTFQGGLEPVARWEYDGRTREALDPDDYHGGFALWSGTSFAAPVVAGKIADADDRRHGAARPGRQRDDRGVQGAGCGGGVPGQADAMM